MVKRIFKYPTGAEVPKGAKYLNTVVQTRSFDEVLSWHPCYLVWHYYEVDDVSSEVRE